MLTAWGSWSANNQSHQFKFKN